MAKAVKIVSFINDREGREEAERELTRMVNDGWVIISSGGGTGADLVWGFVILQKDDGAKSG
jgi:hypothetical protein